MAFFMSKKSGKLCMHCKNVRVILTLSGLAQLHLFRGFYAVKHCMMWATIETSEQIQLSQP